jgi:DNA-binding NarL/FixJ family response regulator
MLETIERLLSGFEVVGRVKDGQALVEAALLLKPDVIVTDISMPVLHGIGAAEKLREAGSLSRIIFLTVHTDPDFVSKCLETGALGYVDKARLLTDLLPAIDAVRAGQVFVSASVKREQ